MSSALSLELGRNTRLTAPNIGSSEDRRKNTWAVMCACGRRQQPALSTVDVLQNRFYVQLAFNQTREFYKNKNGTWSIRAKLFQRVVFNVKYVLTFCPEQKQFICFKF